MNLKRYIGMGKINIQEYSEIKLLQGTTTHDDDNNVD